MREYFSKEVTGIFCKPGRSLAQVSIEARLMPEPGILAKIASIMAEMNVRILSLSLTSRRDRRYITAFIDYTESRYTIQDLVERLRRERFTVQVRHSIAEPSGLLVDKHCFPLETMGGRIRALMIPVETLSKIFSSFRETYGKVSYVLAFHQGKVLGEMVAKKLLEIFPGSPMETAQTLAWLYSAYGWGRMRIASYSRVSDEARVEIEDNFEVEGYGRSSEPVCHFTRGILSGSSSVIFGGEYEVVEVSCKAQGKNLCEFVIRRKEPEHRGR